MTDPTKTPHDSDIENNGASGPTPSENNPETIVYIILNVEDSYYTVPAAFYNAVRLQVEEIIPALEPGVKYTLEILCGKAFWDPQSYPI